MTVSHSITATFDAPDAETAEWVEDFIGRFLMGEPWGTWEDARAANTCLPTLTNQSFVAGPAMPVDPAWVASDGG